jgi:AcrR family transcriptional regulator
VTAGDPDPCSPRRPGRPRDARAGEVIAEAAAAVLADVGPQGFTVEAVASAAGVGKATIYRRWPTRGALMLDAASRLHLEVRPVDTGSVREDLTTHLIDLATKLTTTPSGKLLASVLAEAFVNPDMRTRLRAFIIDRRSIAKRAVERGIARGELPAGTDPEVVLDVLGSPVFFRFLTGDDLVDPAVIAWTVDAVVSGANAIAARRG